MIRDKVHIIFAFRYITPRAILTRYNYLDNFGSLFKSPISNAGKYYEFTPGEISEIVESDDKTLSKDRLLTVPA